MWLLPVFHRLSALALSLYYRVSRAGHAVDPDGPVLLVANHPNSLVDPALVAYAAQRPVRFLAKSTLFTMPALGWLVRGSGAIPVYRKADDPAQMERNVEMFAAVHAALARGDAVGLFPEGLSHDQPSLAPLKTGAARIALGAAQLVGRDFPIVPVGLVFREKATFRSRAHAIVGRRIAWSDLARRGESDAEAVRMLTTRINAGLREITVNLEKWEDAPIVELAESVYAAEYNLRPDAMERMARLREITTALSRMRERGDESWVELAEDLRIHARQLRWVGLSPRSLKVVPRTGSAIWWSFKRIPLALVALSGIWLAGALVFWPPYQVTGMIGRRARRKSTDVVSTFKLLGGAAAFAAWIVLLSAAAGVLWGVRAGAAALLLLPVLAVVSLLVRERMEGAIQQARRFFRLTGGGWAVEELRERQRELAARLGEVGRGR